MRGLIDPQGIMIRSVALVLVAALAVSAAWESAGARALKADYFVAIRGFPVGKAKLRAEIAEESYSVAFSGGVSGLARLFASISAEAQATGRIGSDRPRTDAYSHVWVEDDETETVTMRFNGKGVEDIAIEPPIDRPERYVPMTAEMKADAVDLVSAFLWPAASAGPDACARTLRLIDGRRRFNIEAAYARMESFSTRRGSRYHRAVVCALSYEPVAGHRADKPLGEGFLSDGSDMEVWLVSAGGGLVAPVRVQLTTRIGRVVMEATRFEAD